ncbi:glycosyltransferase family 2 protein [Aequorivita lipolytica]|uniref:Glycosyltransferase family 2 protein n=1 Tax=Aequorivita lipolytica TaxID=153267 RepID=A0A5C6YPI7_9FLAO|nr:glycosyltransferase family 2 protein [Aequorivita lipolytica]TXD68792.1 glycosyltransferase family 2 protein [Aequorivita lipolytica]SRX52041.1 putative glycosyltransferase EpsJ [Aequorivita lipolytica]
MEVSVIIPAYNAASFVERAVKSALRHTEVKEILLIEDGSKDNTLQICKELRQQHNIVKLFQHNQGENQGAGATRNLGIRNATQNFIAFLDADDYYTEIRFQKEKEIFKKHPDADGVYGAIGVEYLDAVGAKAWEAKGFDHNTLTTVNKPVDPDHLFAFLTDFDNPKDYDGYFSIDAFTIKREQLLTSEIKFDASLRLHQDTIFLWQAAYALNLYTGEFEKPLAMRCVHSDNRFIHTKKLNASRSKMYKVMRDWTILQKLQNNFIEFFNQKYFEHYISSKEKTVKHFSYLKLLLVDRRIRNNFSKKQLKFVLRQIFS